MAPRETHPSKSNILLDLLRVLAMVGVVMRHYPNSGQLPVYSWLRKYDWSVIEIFFVLSGYLITTQIFSLMRTKKSLGEIVKHFYARRALKVFPVFLLVTGLYFVFPMFREDPGIAPLWKFLTFTQNFGLDPKTEGAFAQAWTLCVEVHFYILLPWIVYLFSKNSWRRKVPFLLAGFLLSQVGLRALLWFYFIRPLSSPDSFAVMHDIFRKEIFFPTYSHFDGIIYGVSIAWLRFCHPESWSLLTRNRTRVLLSASVVLVFSLFAFPDFHSWASGIFGYSVFALGFSALIIACLGYSGFWADIKVPVVTHLAKWSYPIYLVHTMVIHVIHAQILDWGFDPFTYAMTAVTVLGILLVSFILYKLVEEPLLRLRS